MATPPPSSDSPAASAYLLVRDPIVGRTVRQLMPGERVTLGRAPTNHIVVHDERASRFHAEIVPTPDGWSIRDLESRNGTLLGAEPVSCDRPLEPGDVVGIGRVEIAFCAGDPPTDAAGGSGVVGGTSTGEMPADLERWHASITHRRARSRLLDDIRESVKESAGTAPRVGRAAAELCRLAFALGRAADSSAVAMLALESAMRGAGASRGVVLLPGLAAGAAAAVPDHGPGAPLDAAAALPDPWPPEAIPRAAIATVLGTDEAVLASATQPGGSPASITAPVRSNGRAVGVMHLEAGSAGREPTADDLEFVMAVCDALGLAIDNLAAREILSTRLATAADENRQLKRRLGEESRMVGASEALRAIGGQIGMVASTKATVLVRGESGSGKELVARAIHEASDRKSNPFVCLNCAALSETLLESELFGHEKGAFTGATERKAGKFESAHKGTLMLDEIGEMSPAIQAKFLRVLEGHPFERVGGSARVQVDVRVVAATNRNLEEAVAAGDFRRDLYFRLKVVEIIVPPLRRRAEDIEPLARHFLARFAVETGRRVRDFTPEALEAMRSYHWPGNIRELRNAIERAVVLSQDDRIDVHELALSSLSSAGDTGRSAAARPGPYVPESIDEVERRHVLATLEAVGGNKTKAAAVLGIERSTLDRKLARWAKV
jgi:transcriptional regulator with GAF, ATPase, and Fis domain